MLYSRKVGRFLRGALSSFFIFFIFYVPMFYLLCVCEREREREKGREMGWGERVLSVWIVAEVHLGAGWDYFTLFRYIFPHSFFYFYLFGFCKHKFVNIGLPYCGPTFSTCVPTRMARLAFYLFCENLIF